MEERQQLVNLLLTSFGVDLYPKSDGRIEIPKYMITTAGWDSYDKVYMSSDLQGNLYISSDSTFFSGGVTISVAVSHGRLRIPVGFLKRIGIHNRNLVAVYDMNSTLHLRPDNSESEEALVEFVNELNEKDAILLANILMGRAVLDNYIPNMEIVRVSVNQKPLPEAEMFLLEANEQRSFMFRPIGNPYKFKCCWVDKVPHLAYENNDNATMLYVIPGIKRIKKNDGGTVPGFLIIDETTFGKICYVVKKKGDDTAIGKDLIFMFSPRVRIGSFKVFENPKEDLDPKIIEEAKQVCANPERFLSSNFSLFKSGNCDLPPTTITVNTIGKINKREQA